VYQKRGSDCWPGSRNYEVESGAGIGSSGRTRRASSTPRSSSVGATHVPSNGPSTMLWTQRATRTRAEGASHSLLWPDFIEAPPAPLAASTKSLYQMQWRVHIRPRLGERRINSFGPQDVRRFMADLKRDGVGATSVDSVHRLLRRLLAAAVKDPRIAFNPASGIHAPRPPKRTCGI
jgi:hypothetical protein